MKKIQVSTVKQTADVEVIYINSYFVSKCVRAQAKLEHVCENLNVFPATATGPEDASEERCINVDGHIVDAKTGEPILVYERSVLEPWQVETLAKDMVEFFKELVNSFETE